MTVNILFFVLSALVLYGGLKVITLSHPITAALHLAGTMLAAAGLFFILGAHFIAGVQVLVYAGAVMVLFVMVVMLFNLKDEKKLLFSHFTGVKGASVFFLTGLLAGMFPYSLYFLKSVPLKDASAMDVKALAQLIFGEYVLTFELMGVLLLVIAVGAAVLCRRVDKKEA